MCGILKQPQNKFGCNWAAGIYACDNTPIFRFFQISKRTQTKGSDSQKYKSGKFSYYRYIKSENGKLQTTQNIL